MLEKLELTDVGPAPHIAVDFAPRLNILTGDNGLGKTFLLDVAWWALTRTWAGQPAWPQPGKNRKPTIGYAVRGKSGRVSPVKIAYRFMDQVWPLPHRRPPSPGLVVYARVDGGFSVWDPARNYWRNAPSLEIQQLDRPAAYHFNPTTLWDGLTERDERSGKTHVHCNGLVRDWVTWQLQKAAAFAQLESVLAALSPGHAEPLRPATPGRVSLDDARDIPFLETPYGTIPILHASAGAKRILGLAYLLVWAWQEHVKAAELIQQGITDRVILLIDELEAHLHPQWQRLILPALMSIVRKLHGEAKIQLIAASHAPLVLASIEPEFDDEQDKLIHFKLEERRVIVEEIPWAKQGDAVGWLVSESFGLRQARSAAAEVAIEAAEAFMRDDFGELPENLRTQKDIHNELLRVLAGHDPFWPRWIVYSEQGEP